MFFTESVFSTDIHKIKNVPFTNVKVLDNFWASRIETNRIVSIPSAFQKSEENGRFDNFALAANLITGEHKGDYPFDDTDPYKIIEGASYSLAVKYDANLDHYLDSVINLIVLAQEPDGYLTTCVTNNCTRLAGWWGTHRWEKINSHELYNCGHLYEAAVAHYQSTGKRTLLNVALKNADLICEVFGPNEGQVHRPSGHPIVEMALLKLYNLTGEEKYMKLARYFVEETGRGTDGHQLSEYSQDHKPILEQDEIVGHAVRAGYLYSGVTDLASLSDDEDYMKALETIWDNMAEKKLYITGGIGSRDQGEGFGPNYELNNQTAYCETCASISNVFWNDRMFKATAESKYIDLVERALYNGVISGVSLSGDKFFYDNPLESSGQHDRAPWFGCACCPGNITRFMASLPEYIYAQEGNNVYVNLYVQSKAHVETENNNIDLEQTTQYPWFGQVKINVNPKSAARFSVFLRIPGWLTKNPTSTDLYSFKKDQTKDFKVLVNGKEMKANIVNGYLQLDRNWKENDVIMIDLPMDVKRLIANHKVEDDHGKSAISRGPIVYCIEGVDQEDHKVFNKYVPENAKFEANFRSEKLNGIVELETEGIEVLEDANNNRIEKTVKIKAIPYATWENRGPNEMAVWIPTTSKFVQCTPKPTIASKAYSVNAYGVNDQWEPKNSSDISKPYFYWWLKKGTEETLTYDLDTTYEVSSVDVYWLQLDHYDAIYRAPENWHLYFKNENNEWQEVEHINEYSAKLDQYNKLKFKPIKTNSLKIVAQLKEGASGGILEWKIN